MKSQAPPHQCRSSKIDGSTLKTFEIVMASFKVEDKLRSAWFFQETYLVANIRAEVVLGMLFLNLNNADIQMEKELI